MIEWMRMSGDVVLIVSGAILLVAAAVEACINACQTMHSARVAIPVILGLNDIAWNVPA
jgi:hypothetical protein